MLASVCIGLWITTPAPAHAASPVNVVMGTTWDGPGQGLQSIVDAYLGTPGAIDVRTDFIGAHAGDLDPWFWVGARVPNYLITEVAANAGTNELGWYRETFSVPVIDGADDGVVFDGPAGEGANVTIMLGSSATKFGFYLNTHVLVPTASGPREQIFFTNRMLNDPGTGGAGATHAPVDGDVQVLVFDVSAWKGPNTWLVCFEDTDSGSPLGPCCTGTDADFNDAVFQVTASGATPTSAISIGAIKSIYR